jgi:hypothetical protein
MQHFGWERRRRKGEREEALSERDLGAFNNSRAKVVKTRMLNATQES